jgi:hypothetical protein
MCLRLSAFPTNCLSSNRGVRYTALRSKQIGANTVCICHSTLEPWNDAAATTDRPSSITMAQVATVSFGAELKASGPSTRFLLWQSR